MGLSFCCQGTLDNNQLDLVDDFKYSKATSNSRTERLRSSKRSKGAFNQKSIITIQKMFRSYLAKQRLKKLFKTYIKNIQKILQENVVNNSEQKIANHPGEIISKKVEQRYGNYIQNYPNPKFSIFSKATYVNKSINKDFYFGYWNIEHEFHGYGILYKENGCKYEGYWYNGKLNGNGRYFTKKGDFYIGNFKDGSANGDGIFFQNRNNSLYKGAFKNDLRHGQGEEMYIDNFSSFKGTFSNGKKVKGIIKWKDGSYYNGYFKGEKFEGQGKYYWNEGREYVGEWSNGQINGKGKFTYLNGSYYDGEFINGQRNGYGKYVWNEDKQYIGEWLNGKQHGKGKYIKKEKVLEGIWSNGKVNTVITQTGFSNEERITGGFLEHLATVQTDESQTLNERNTFRSAREDSETK